MTCPIAVSMPSLGRRTPSRARHHSPVSSQSNSADSSAIPRVAATRPCTNSAPSSMGWAIPAARSVRMRPPTRSRASSTTTRMPDSCNTRAADRPATPAPTTITSVT